MRDRSPLILLLAGCLPPAPPPAAAPAALHAVEPVATQAALAEAGAPALRGRVVGACTGVVRIEAGTGSSRPLAATAVVPGPYVLRVPTDTAVQLRWGCDADEDGFVAGENVAEASLTALAADLALDLRLVDPALAARFPLTVPAPADAAGPTAPVDGASTPVAPADGAVGPPLPDGPPPDAGPPPPTGAAPAVPPAAVPPPG